jgi:hypothetical protein
MSEVLQAKAYVVTMTPYWIFSNLEFQEKLIFNEFGWN